MFYRDEMQKRLQAIKREKEKARQEKARQEWKESNHAPQVAEVNKYLMQLHIEIMNRSTFENILSSIAWQELDKLRALYIDFVELLEFERFSSVITWGEKLNEQKEK